MRLDGFGDDPDAGGEHEDGLDEGGEGFDFAVAVGVVVVGGAVGDLDGEESDGGGDEIDGGVGGLGEHAERAGEEAGEELEERDDRGRRRRRRARRSVWLGCGGRGLFGLCRLNHGGMVHGEGTHAQYVQACDFRPRLWFGGVVEADGAEGVAGPGRVGEAGFAEEFDHAGRAGEALDGGVEVAVGGLVAGDEAAEFRQDGFEVEVVDGAGEAFGLVALEDAELAAGAEDAEDFGEAFFVVGEIAEAEGGGDEIDGGVGEGRWRASASMGRMLWLANFFWPRESIWWEKSTARMGATAGCWLLVVGCWLGRCLRRAIVMSPVPQQRSRATVSGCWRMGRKSARGAGPPGAVDADGEEWLARS